MNHKSSLFKWRHYTPDVILLCVRWYVPSLKLHFVVEFKY